MSRNRSAARRTPKANPRGVLRVHPAGYGFVLTAEGEFFIADKFMKGAFDGDLVEIAPLKVDRERTRGENPRRDGKVVAILERAHTEIVGRVEVAEPFAVVIPADPHITHDIFTMRADAPDVPDGAIVRVAMVTYPDRNSAATGHITEVLATDAQVAAVDLILARYHLEGDFPEGAKAEARAACLDADGALARGYRDIRDRTVFSIDPDDAKDYDDAVSFWTTPDGKRHVGVHIADVSAYVPWDSALDAEAKRRATSVYAVDRVIPMLPEELSNGLCSLVAGEDRLCMTVDMTLDSHARVTAADIYPAVMRSRARLTYGRAQQVIDGESPDEVPETVAQAILALHAVARGRVALAAARGALDFDREEAKVRLDEKGVPVEVVLRRKSAATSLIEECMIMANVAVAEFLSARQHPGAFRVHERPDVDALGGLLPVFSRFAWFRGTDTELFCMGDPSTIAKVLVRAHESDAFEVVSMLLLRAMKRAQYRPTDDGHYGLGLEHYCHFTSPIRRYPDLMVHRMVKQALGLSQPAFGSQVAALPALCQHSSDMEQVAEDTARDIQEYKLIEFMQKDVGQRFRGIIAGVSAHCLYVRLDNTAEGTVSFADMGNEYFGLDARQYLLRGESTAREYRLGDALDVVLLEADPKTRTLRFKPAR